MSLVARFRLTWFVALVAWAGCAPVAVAQTRAPARALQAVVDSVAESAGLRRVHWGVHVVDRASGRVLATRAADRNFVPASNQKLLLTAFALAELGPDYRFETPLLAVGRRGERADALMIVGRGDPSMAFRFLPGEYAALDSLADSVAVRGIREVGELIVDATFFEAQRLNPGWDVGDLAWGYSAPVEAFGVGEGAFRFELLPGDREGAPAVVRAIGRAGAVPLRSDVVTGAPRSGLVVDLTALPGSDTVVVSGSIALGAAPDTTPVAAPLPAQYGAELFARSLAARGVRVARVRVVHDSAQAAALRARGEGLAAWRSPPLHDILARFMKPSRNWHAEMILKTIAALRTGRGSWAEGLRLQRRFLIDAAGIDSAAFVLRDASGLASGNLLTATMLVQFLDWSSKQPWAPHFRAALTEPGEVGTLRNRLLDYRGRLQGKTGTIEHTVTLSGFLRADDGRELIFAILANGTGVPSSRVQAGANRIVQAAATTAR